MEDIEISHLIDDNSAIQKLPIAHYNQSNIPTSIETQDDFEYARSNIREIIKTSMDAIGSLSQICESSPHPKLFDSLNQLLKNASEINKDLLEISKASGNSKKDDKVVNNNMFVGSTKELLDLINGK